jgi:hypothetical protein
MHADAGSIGSRRFHPRFVRSNASHEQRPLACILAARPLFSLPSQLLAKRMNTAERRRQPTPAQRPRHHRSSTAVISPLVLSLRASLRGRESPGWAETTDLIAAALGERQRRLCLRTAESILDQFLQQGCTGRGADARWSAGRKYCCNGGAMKRPTASPTVCLSTTPAET